jgi:GTP-binding protein
MPFVGYCPLVFVSSKTGQNVRRSVEAIDHVAAQVRTVLPTGVLNRILVDAYDRSRPAAIKGKRLKIYYATQVGQAPIRIRVFVNFPQFVQASYTNYLVRSIRERFGLEGAPVFVDIRERNRPPNPFVKAGFDKKIRQQRRAKPKPRAE